MDFLGLQNGQPDSKWQWPHQDATTPYLESQPVCLDEISTPSPSAATVLQH